MKRKATSSVSAPFSEVRLHANHHARLGAGVRYSHHITCVVPDSEVPVKLQAFV